MVVAEVLLESFRFAVVVLASVAYSMIVGTVLWVLEVAIRVDM